MTTFATPFPPATAAMLVTPSAPVPAGLRFAGDALRWIGLPAGTAINTFATGCVARASGTTGGIPGQPAAAWTAFQLSPLPQFDPAAFKLILPGLPVQIVVVPGSAGPTPAADDLLAAGASLVTAPAGPGATAFLGFAFQDRICRDALGAAEAIAASGACDGDWAGMMALLAGLPAGRSLRVLDHRGAPLAGMTVGVSVGGGPVQAVALTPAMDGDSGIAVPANAAASVTVPGRPHAMIAGVDADIGAFESALVLPAGKRMVQVLDAADWLAQPDTGVSLPRWHANSDIEPIQDGTPYFTKLVGDLRSAKGGGAAQIAGWAVVKGSLADSSVDWPLIPGDASTTVMALVNELRGGNAQVRMLLNQFLQFDSQTLDDFPDAGRFDCHGFLGARSR